MQNYKKSLIPIIEANYDKYTETEKMVANFFICNKEKSNLAATNIAKEIAVSEATLSRFAQKCGYSGYREFIYEYKNSFLDNTELVNTESLLVLQTYQDLLNKMYNLINLDQIHRISTYFKKSKNVYVCGRGSSGLAAEEMTTRFRWIGVNAMFLRDNENMKMQSVFLSDKDCVIGISLSGTKSEILYMLKRGYKQGAKTVLITEKTRKEYEEYCDEIILVPSLVNLNQGNLISPQFPVLLMIDIMYADFVNSDKKRIYELQNQIQDALNN